MKISFKGQLLGSMEKKDKPGQWAYTFQERGGSSIRFSGQDVLLDPKTPELVPLEVEVEVKGSVLSGLNYLVIKSISCRSIPAF